MRGWTPMRLEMELGEGAWSDEGMLLNGRIERIGVLPNGTSKGRPAVGMLVRLDDGRAVGCWTTYNLFITAARALQARYGEPTG